MINKLLSVKSISWFLLAVVFLFSVGLATIRYMNLLPVSTLTYIVQPMTALLVFGLAFWNMRGCKDRIRRKLDKAYIVGAVFAIWFVFYMASGLVTTYVHNALVTDLRGVFLNIMAFVTTAACLEYVRYAIISMAGRRNFVWYGVIVSLIFGLLQLSVLGILSVDTLEKGIRLIVSDIIPVFASSALLTYLTVTSGVMSMLVYRVAYVLATILPPFIPKYDWYMQGISVVFLVIAIYLAIDSTRQDKKRRLTRRHVNYAPDVVFIVALSVTALFMIGAFAYKPIAIMSDSMKPVFSKGSVVITEKITSSMDIKVGDVIQYEAEEKMVTHRVVAISVAKDKDGGRIFTTKGDNSPSVDEPVSENQLYGVVRYYIPFIGYPTVWLKELSR